MHKRGFRLDIASIVFYLILAAVILFAINVDTIWQFLTSHYSDNGLPLSVDYSAISPPLFNYLNKFNSLTLMIFWAIVGTIGYVLAVWLETAFSSALEEAKEAKYIRPKAKQATYWRTITINNLKLVGLIVSWVVSLYVFLQVLLPRLSNMLDKSLNSGTFEQRASFLASAIILTATGLYLIVELGHLLRHGWRQLTVS